MAKQSNYNRIRRNYMERVRYQRVRGYSDYTDVYIPTEAELIRQGYTQDEIDEMSSRLLFDLRRRPIKEEYYPDEGEMVFNNLMEEFVSKLQSADLKLDPKSNNGRYRSNRARYASQQAQSYLLNLIEEEVARRGEKSVGESFARNSEILSIESLEYVLYGSDEATINSILVKIAMAIRDEGITRREQELLSEESEYLEDWDEY